MKVPKELEYLEGLVKLVKRKKDEEIGMNQVAPINNTPVVKRIFVNKTCRRIIMHLLVEVNNGVIEGLVDIGALMLIMVVSII